MPKENKRILAKAVLLYKGLNRFIMKLDGWNLWWVGIPVLVILFFPMLLLGEGSVIGVHDQLDETLLTYVLNARYMGTGTDVFPEMMGGVQASGMQPSAILFIPLYRLFPAFWAFMLQYLIVIASGYYGMFLCVRKITGSSILAVITAACFSLLPFQPVYGLSVAGVPLFLYAVLSLYERKNGILNLLLLVFFGLTTHLILIGYVVLSFFLLAVVVLWFRKKHNGWFYGGFFLLTGVYIWVNRNLFYELVFRNSEYVSHRVELVNYPADFWQSVKDVFLHSSQHAPSYHLYLILPVCILLLVQGIRFQKLRGQQKKFYIYGAAIFGVLVLIAVFFGLCRSSLIVDWKNSMTGFLRYFQAERYYWLYPAGWYLGTALLLATFWKGEGTSAQVFKLVLLAAILLPTLRYMKEDTPFYQNVNHINNGYGITGYLTWENFYSADLMEILEDEIGRDMSDYRVAHLGMSPAPALLHGFYTIDGYSNNYSLAYKQEFRKIIQDELALNEEVRLYFDEWGSRCYLFNSESGISWLISKNANVKYTALSFNTEQMKKMGCEYLFSAGEVLNARELGLELMGYFDTADSYFGVWLYEIRK